MSDSGKEGMIEMEATIREMQQNLKEGCYVAFIPSNEDNYCPITKSDDLDFLDDKTVLIRRKNGWNTIINLNLIIEVCIRRFGQYA